ncbi:hypothetical protein KUCAC02_010639 [Chaenocephalus aceratus]|uniref:Uncharacterized protein n=1 Tax=Chaenocephalus aceratus TaxID=36190 RepID=A0ACB9W0F6_CHAAC|nr:hypothetical protein KUCAC02_010639 [Chaenocephalus aceratus]
MAPKKSANLPDEVEEIKKSLDFLSAEIKTVVAQQNKIMELMGEIQSLKLQNIEKDNKITFLENRRSITVSLSDSGFVGALAKCRKTVGHFKHSPANTAELQVEQGALGQKEEPLIQDVPTRWNSTLEMVKRLIRNQAAIKATLDQQQHKLVMLTPPEWDNIQRLETLLEPCR